MRTGFDWLSYDLIVVGAGFYGSVIAERTASKLGKRVLVVERRPHIGGNAFTEVDPETNIEVHKYGAHIFHTPSEIVWSYINRFSGFSNYVHKVYAVHNRQIYSLPINLGTICQFFGRHFSPEEAQRFLKEMTGGANTRSPANLEEKAISLIGKELYEAFIKGYTEKQWQTHPSQLPANVINRLPVRFNFDNRYFSDRFQGLPLEGYTEIFKKMLSSPLISTCLGVDYIEIRKYIPEGIPVIYTGPIDKYFDYVEGELGWRTLDFEYERFSVDDYQGTSVLNYSDGDVPYTRVVEFRHFSPERQYKSQQTIIAREYSRFAGRDDEPFYPINTFSDKQRLEKYKARAECERDVLFGGRLGSYRYLDMHQAIGAALRDFEQIVSPRLCGQALTRQAYGEVKCP